MSKRKISSYDQERIHGRTNDDDMSRKKKVGCVGNPSNPWIVVDNKGNPERKDGNQIRKYLNRKRCEDYIRNRNVPGKLMPIRLKDLDVANIIMT